MRTDNRITHSEMQAADKCLRKEFLCYQLGLRPERDATPLRIGSAVHYGLDLYKKGAGPTDAIKGTMVKFDSTQPKHDDYLYDWEIERVTISAMLNGYFWRWADMDKTIRIIASEQVFNIPIINPNTGRAMRTATAAGKTDGIGELLYSNQLAIIEHKTNSEDLSAESDLWKMLRIDGQISLYYLAAQKMGYDVQTVLYDVLRKPTKKPYKATPTEKRKYKKDGSLYANMRDKNETPNDYAIRINQDMGENPDFYFARREIPRIESDLKEFEYDLWHKAKLIQECKNNNRWPKATGACRGFGKCPYFDLCVDGYDINSGIVPEGYIRVNKIHQELEQENDYGTTAETTNEFATTTS